MERENMLRLAVKARKRYLIRMLIASDFYQTHDSLTRLEEEFNQLTLSELEERWDFVQKAKDDQIG